MIIVARSAISRLCQKGTLDVWSPKGTTEPAMNIIHVVRVRARGETFARAKPVTIRTATLQRLTYEDALNAGFRTRDDFYTWWRRRYATGPLLDRIRCWVVSYERVVDDIPQFLDRRGYTVDGHRSIDVDVDVECRKVPLEAVRDPYYLRRWAQAADDERQANPAVIRFPWEARRRVGGEARKFRRLAS